MSFNDLQAHERITINRVIREARHLGWQVAVTDEEELMQEPTDNLALIKRAIGHSDLNFLDIWFDGQQIGQLMLVYGNGPGEVIADYSANPRTEHLYRWATEDDYEGQL